MNETPKPIRDLWGVWIVDVKKWLGWSESSPPHTFLTEQVALDTAHAFIDVYLSGLVVAHMVEPHRHRMTLIDAVGDETIIEPETPPGTAPRPARP